MCVSLHPLCTLIDWNLHKKHTSPPSALLGHSGPNKKNDWCDRNNLIVTISLVCSLTVRASCFLSLFTFRPLFPLWEKRNCFARTPSLLYNVISFVFLSAWLGLYILVDVWIVHICDGYADMICYDSILSLYSRKKK